MHMMRLWSVHPKYLDSKGLVALWREALLAKHVLEGKTKGYKHHPQLIRFKALPDPVSAINAYLAQVYAEAQRRNFCFDASKFSAPKVFPLVPVTSAQLDFELQHLLAKCALRDKEQYAILQKITRVIPHPLFRVVTGPIESWEKL
jgi:hypothetical protein